MKSRPYVKGAPLKAKGGVHSTMEKEKGANKIKEPGSKYGSNSMSPGQKAGKINTYGE